MMLYEERLDRLQNQWDKDTYLKAGKTPALGKSRKGYVPLAYLVCARRATLSSQD
jgi:hypothetical protein